MRWRTTAEPMKPAPPVTRNRLAITLPSSRKWGNECLEVREFGVLAGDGHSGGIDRPGDAQAGIVPAQPRIASRRIECIYFVGDLGVRFERAEPVGEPHRHEELLAAIRRQCGREEAPIRGATTAQIDGGIENRSMEDPNQLVLRFRGRLEM